MCLTLKTRQQGIIYKTTYLQETKFGNFSITK